MAETDICVICCYKSDYFCVGQCDHRVCFECGTRMRVLCQLNECSICRTQMPFVYVINGDDNKTFSSIDGKKFIEKDLGKQYGFKFENEEAYSAVVDILAHVCTICKEEPEFRSFDNLSQHMRRKHELFYCDLCVEHLKLFSWERKCYNRGELAQHRRTGDPDDRSHKGHPLCEFCDERYLDNDFLYRHLRRDHFFCHFCDADGKTKIFYPDTDKLKEHFKAEHYLCEIGNCRNEHLGVAFRHEVDFKAHKGNVHGRDIQKGELKKELQVNINFNYGPTPTRERFAKQQNDRQVRNYSDQRERSNNVGTRQPTDNRQQKPNQPAAAAAAVAATANVHAANSDVQVIAPPVSAPDDNFDLKREDFPSLHQNRTGAVSKSRKPSNQTDSKSGGKHTLSNIVGKTGRSGSLGENDFPALNVAQNSGVARSNNSKEKQSPRFRRDSRSVSPKHNRKVPTGFRMVDDDEEFPSCSSSTAASHSEQNKAPEDNAKTVENSKAPVKPILPSWGPPRIVGSEVKDSNFPALPTTTTTTKTSKKAKTTKTDSANKNNNVTKTVWAQKVQSQPPQPKTSEPVQSAALKLDRKEFPALVSLPKTKARARLVAQNKQRPSVEESKKDETSSISKNDDSEKSETGCYMGPPGFEPGSEHNNVSNISRIKPPPGLQNAAQSNITDLAPPGFEPSPSVGIISNGYPRGDGGAHAKENIATSSTVSSYIKPKTFQRRNRDLFDFLSENLLDDNLREFKMLSSLYKNGELSSDCYYISIKSLLGEKLFRKCFAELVCLLPDISKQNGLLRAHKAEQGGGGSGGVPWKKDVVLDSIRTCQLCKQITSVDDYAEHCSSHSSVDDEYPALY